MVWDLREHQGHGSSEKFRGMCVREGRGGVFRRGEYEGPGIPRATHPYLI